MAWDDFGAWRWQLAVLLSLLASLFVLRWLVRSQGRWNRTLRERFLFGVPWGSAITITGVLSAYLFVQGGFWHWERPVTTAFTASSYFYPTGVVFAAFSHSHPGHLLNNLTSAIVFAPLAEYVWGHYPREGEATAASRSRSPLEPWRTNPWLRAFVLFPGAVFLVGLATALFSWGPIIGFSGVVFAFVGFSLVRYPLLTIVALVARRGIRTFVNTLTEPVVVAETTVEFSQPWWSGTAVQGHVLGFLLGVLLGVLLVWRRDERPHPLELWVASVLTGLWLSLWAFWWIRGPETFVLYGALGVIAVFALSSAVTIAVTATDRPVYGRVTRRSAALSLLLALLVVMSLVAVPLNLVAVESDDRDRALSVGEYAVFYTEETEDERISYVDLTLFGETTNLTTSGVIVVNEDRHTWHRALSAAELRTYGEAHVTVGGFGWQSIVDVDRSGWHIAGNETAYRVYLEHEGERVHAFESGPVEAEPVVDDRRIAIAAEEGGFYLDVEHDGSVERAPVPDQNESVTANEIEFVREDGAIVAESGETHVTVAERETYDDDPPDENGERLRVEDRAASVT